MGCFAAQCRFYNRQVMVTDLDRYERADTGRRRIEQVVAVSPVAEVARSNAALLQGPIENVAAYGDVLTYERHIRRQPFFIALNIGAADADVQSHAGIVPLSTAPGRDGQRLAEGANRPAPAEALIASL